jgi:hypothetical protein
MEKDFSPSDARHDGCPRRRFVVAAPRIHEALPRQARVPEQVFEVEIVRLVIVELGPDETFDKRTQVSLCALIALSTRRRFLSCMPLRTVSSPRLLQQSHVYLFIAWLHVRKLY